jgi:threonine dehydrogenase-like Zn-dependent dehydrogenase
MRAARKTADGVMVLTTIETPVPRGNELLVSVEACGICGSDRHMLLGEFPTAVPVIQGHEFCGIVVGRGPEVERMGSVRGSTAILKQCCGHPRTLCTLTFCEPVACCRMHLCWRDPTRAVRSGAGGALSVFWFSCQACRGVHGRALQRQSHGEAGRSAGR